MGGGRSDHRLGARRAGRAWHRSLRGPRRAPAVEVGGGAVGGGWFGYLGYQLAALVEPVPPSPPRPVPIPTSSLAFYDHVLRCDTAGQWWFEALWSRGRRGAAQRAPRAPARAAGRAGRRAATATAAVTFRARAHARRATWPRFATAASRSAPASSTRPTSPCVCEAGLEGAAIDLFATCVARLRPRYAAFVGDRDRAGRQPVPRALPGPPRAGRCGRRRSRARRRATARRRRRASGLLGVREGPRRERDDRRPHAQRPRARVRVRLGHGRRAGRRARRTRASGISSPTCAGALAPGASRPRPAARDIPAGIGHRRAEGQGDGGHRRAWRAPRARPTRARSATRARSPGWSSTSRSAPSRSPAAAVWLGAGGGIVADSDPEAEYRECLDKARRCWRRRRGCAGPVAGAGRRAWPRRAPYRAIPGPDPARGRARDARASSTARPIELERHLERLRASAHELYGPAVGDAVSALERPGARGGRPPASGGRPAPEARCCGRRPARRRSRSAAGRPEADVLPPAWPIELLPVTVPGGLGPHKWARPPARLATPSRAAASGPRR